jgi:hypothetical protein
MGGIAVQTPPAFVQLPLRHWQKAPAPQSLSALHTVHGVVAVDASGHACPTSWRTLTTQLSVSCLARTVVLTTDATHAA